MYIRLFNHYMKCILHSFLGSLQCSLHCLLSKCPSSWLCLITVVSLVKCSFFVKSGWVGLGEVIGDHFTVEVFRWALVIGDLGLWTFQSALWIATEIGKEYIFPPNLDLHITLTTKHKKDFEQNIHCIPFSVALKIKINQSSGLEKWLSS